MPNSFFEIPFAESSKFWIFIKHCLLLIDGTSQLYSPSFSVMANKSQSSPEFDDKYIFTFSDMIVFLEDFHFIVWIEPIFNFSLPFGDLIFIFVIEKEKPKIIIQKIYL